MLTVCARDYAEDAEEFECNFRTEIFCDMCNLKPLMGKNIRGDGFLLLLIYMPRGTDLVRSALVRSTINQNEKSRSCRIRFAVDPTDRVAHNSLVHCNGAAFGGMMLQWGTKSDDTA
jgi:hypothetical protein